MSNGNPLAGIPIRAARWSATHPWRAIGGWLALVVAAVALAAMIPTERPADADYRVGDSGRAETLLEKGDLDEAATENVLLTAPDGALDRDATEAAADALTEEMERVDGVAGVAPLIWNDTHSAALVPVTLIDAEDVDVDPMLAVTARVDAAHPDVDLRQAGGESIGDAIDERVGEDLLRAELTSVPITLVLMLIAFGALIAAGIPVLLAATSVAATIGIAAPISHFVPAEPTVASMIVLIGMAVGVDYSLFYLKREREERAAGRTTLDAVEIAAETSGHAILVSGAAVIASLAGLFMLTDVTFNSLAVGAITVVAVAVLGSITVLPALLAKLGRWVDRPRIPLLWRVNRRIGQGGISRRLLGPVIRHPVIALVAASLLVAALAVPALGMKIHSSNLETLPDDITEVSTLRVVMAEFPAEGTSAHVVVEAAPAERERVETELAEVSTAALATGDFTDIGSEVRSSDDGSVSTLELAMPYDESDDRASEAIAWLRSELAGSPLDGLTSEHAVGGGAAGALDYSDRQRQRLPLIIGFVLLLTLLMMARVFRSIPVAVLSTVLNLASVGVAFGLLTVVFQHGNGEDLLDFTSPGFVINWIPLFVMVVLIGLSMDYHVFVLSRVKEYVDRGLPTRLAVRRGITDTAGTVTSAAAVMVSVFSLFIFLSMQEMKMMGVGLAGAILLDATLIRLVMLPAALVLLGDRAWRPANQDGEVVEPAPALVAGR